jgi:flagellar hook-associated protein 2
MTTIPSSLFATQSGTQVSELYASAAKSLMNQNPALKTIDAQWRRDEARLSNLGKIAQALDGFAASAGKMAAGALDLAASASGSGVKARLASSTAAPGVHKVDVAQLAQGQQLASRALPDKNAPLGAGGTSVIRIESGQGAALTTTTVKIGPGENTLEGIAAAMREAGLDAKVVQDGKGYSLSLSGKPGAANGMRIQVAGDPALQGLLTYEPGGSSGMRQQAAAQDAQLTVDGKRITSSTNSVDAAIPGVSLSLVATGKVDVTVTRSPDAIARNVKGVVEAFNLMHADLAELGGKDGDARTAVQQVQEQVGKAFDKADPAELAKMGLSFKGGTLELDEAKLKAAIAGDAEGVAKFFSNGTDGVADRLATAVAQQFASGSALYKQADALEKDMDALADQRTRIAETASRQAMLLMQQYSAAGSGGSSLFGMLQGPPMSAFDFMA